MNKNILISLLVLILIIVAGLLTLPQFRNYFKKSEVQPVNQVQVQNEMVGQVVSVKGNLITVEGLVGSENKVVEFTITPETVLKNSTNNITLEQIKSGKPFKPKFEQKIGKISDLAPKVKITKIQSKENLLTTNSATATEVNYVTFILPTE